MTGVVLELARCARRCSAARSFRGGRFAGREHDIEIVVVLAHPLYRVAGVDRDIAVVGIGSNAHSSVDGHVDYLLTHGATSVFRYVRTREHCRSGFGWVRG